VLGISVLGITLLGRHKSPKLYVSWLLYQLAHLQ
jgi:hypothetical protein